MRKFWVFIAISLLGLLAYKNCARRSQWHPDEITTYQGDAPEAPQGTLRFQITSPAFQPGQSIPTVYACDGNDTSPPLSISGAPIGTQSFALILEDPDSPMPPIFDHWLAWNIPLDTTRIEQGQLPDEAIQGKNSLNNNFYNGPCTPNGTHHYHFNLYALDVVSLDLPIGSSKQQLKDAMKNHILAQAEMIGLYTANPMTQAKLAVSMVEAATRI